MAWRPAGEDAAPGCRARSCGWFGICLGAIAGHGSRHIVQFSHLIRLAVLHSCAFTFKFLCA